MTQENNPEGHLPPRHAGEQQADDAAAVGHFPERHAEHTHPHLGATAMGENVPESEPPSPAPPGTSPENTQEQNMGVTLLSGMREYLRSTDKRIIATNAKVPPSSSASLNYLFRISQSPEFAAQTATIGPLDVKRLFLNLHDYTLKRKPELLAQLRNPQVLRQIYEPYAADVMRFKVASISRAVFVALLHPSSLLDRINERFGAYPFVNRTVIFTAFNTAPQNPEKDLEELVAAVDHFKTETEPQLRAEYEIEGDWDLPFVRFMIQSPLDTETAARRILKNMQTVLREHSHIAREHVAGWAETQVFPHRSPALAAKVEQDMYSPHASLEEQAREKLEQGREQLNRIRRVTERPGASRGIRGTLEQSATMAELTEQVIRRRDEAFNVLNEVRFETVRLEGAVLAYNNSLDEGEAHLKINMDLETLYSIFLAYALDVGTLREKGYELGATTVAWYHDPEVYDRYIAEYVGQEGATAEEIVAAIQYRPTHIEQQMEGLLIRKRMGL